MDQSDAEIDLGTAKALIKRKFSRDFLEEIDIANDYHRAIGTLTAVAVEAERKLSRLYRVTLAQLRAGGHCPMLGQYRHRIGIADTPECRDCGAPEDSARHFLLDCPRLQQDRLEVLGRTPKMAVLTERPTDVAEFIRRSGRLRDQQ